MEREIVTNISERTKFEHNDAVPLKERFMNGEKRETNVDNRERYIDMREY